MQTGKKIGIAIGATVATTITVDLLHMLRMKMLGFKEAKSLAKEKGILNLGAGPGRSFFAQTVAFSPEVAANIDITPNGIPNFMQWNIEKDLPFRNKQFNVVFLSHVLEHLDNWEPTLEEACRVADRVVIVLPHPYSPSGWLSPSHRQHFSKSDIEWIKEKYPNVSIYY